MKLHVIMFYFFCLLFLVGCCTNTTLPQYAPPEENRLVVYTSHKADVYKPIIREFEERTGIWVEVITGGTTELLEQLALQRDDPQVDVMFGGGVETLNSYREFFLSYRCSDVDCIEPQFQEPTSAWTPFSAIPVVLIYNTKLVPSDHLQSWSDLRGEEFTNKIAFADPTKSGSSFTALVTQVFVCKDRHTALEGFASKLCKQQLESSGEVLAAVANGSCLVGITLEESAMQRIAAGDDISMVYPTDGTSCVPDGSAIIAGSPHVENAKRFIDFTVSYEVQQLLETQFYRRSVRTDVVQGNALVPLDKLTLVAYDITWAAENRHALLQQWEALLKKEELQS